VRALTTPTPAGRCFSAAACSDGAYGIERGLIFSFPLRSDGRDWSVVPGLPVNEFGRARLAVSANELKEEKALVAALLGG
jgi:malate dehydrogenase